ncbi:MAG TPA: formylglycine-generating enzyme family protein [Tepidisphaeraceae bacterium]|jgi:formylglycine-generating enzyme required for sulfatase activity|nr:formylglycine-generating enzyme family protein [Tepidisphaeraceae bacterium]
MHRIIPLITLACMLCCQVWATDEPSAPSPDKPFTQTIPGTTISFQMTPIPAGKFLIGSPAAEKDRQSDEDPQFEVRVDAFWMETTAVTWPEYLAFYNTSFQLKNAAVDIPTDRWADVVTYPTPMYNVSLGPALERMGRGEGCPAVAMSQYAARQYTKWLSKKTGRFFRLPTEAEWEYACRAGSTTAYNFGDNPADLKTHGWFVDNSNLKDGDPSYHKVAHWPANKWGLFDMHGNVGQWCIDQYDPAWYAKFKGKSVDEKDCINWPTTRYPIVIRGGGYESEAGECRSASRLHSTRDFNNKDGEFPRSVHWESNDEWVGFRLVCPMKEPSEAEKQKFWDDPDPVTKKIVRGQSREMHEIIPPEKP